MYPEVAATSPEIAAQTGKLPQCPRTLSRLPETGSLRRLRFRGLLPVESRPPGKSLFRQLRLRRLSRMESRHLWKSPLHPLIQAELARGRRPVAFHREDFRRRDHDFPGDCRTPSFSTPASPEAAVPSPSAARTSTNGVTLSPEAADPSAYPRQLLQKLPLRRLAM